MQKQAIFILGPTAVGKTALAIELSGHLPVDIISVDSAMVYRGLDIGSGKPTPAELAIAPHKLINICDPLEIYSAAQFCRDALVEMQVSWDAGRIPLLVGGTMLYFKALQFGLADMPAADPTVRDQLSAEAELLGWPAMHARLALIDPVTAQRLGVNDAQRIQRALELNILTGKPLPEIFALQTVQPLGYKLHSFGLVPATRPELHAKIAQRFKHMLELGLIAEVEYLFQRGDLHADLPAIRSVGYRQVWNYLNGEIDYAVMCEQAIAATRQLAKRQLTWMRSWPQLNTLVSSDPGVLDTIVNSVLDSSNIQV